MAHMSDVALAVSTAVLGAALGPLFESMFARSRASRSVSVGGDNHGPIDQSRRDYRVFVSLPPPRPRHSRPARRGIGRSNGTDPGLTLAIAAVVIATVCYLRYQSEIILGLFIAGTFCISFLLSALSWARWKKVCFDRRLTFQGALLLPFAALTFADLACLRTPPLYRGGTHFQAIVRSARTMGFSDLLDKYGSDAMLFIVYQVLGLFFAIIALMAVVRWSAILLALTNATISPNPESRWWRLARSADRSGALAALAGVLLVLSLFLTSGWVYSHIPRESLLPASSSAAPSGSSSPSSVPTHGSTLSPKPSPHGERLISDSP